MKKETTIDKVIVSRAVISNIIYDKNPEMVHARHITGYDTPDKVVYKGKEKGYTPDITAFYDKSLNVYEIELGPKPDPEKWKLFSLYTRMNKGRLFLVVPDYLREKLQQQMKDLDIKVGIIYFET